MATIFRPVVVTRVAKRRLVGEVSVASNLLLTLLAVTAAAPFSRNDWPNPRPRAERQDVQQAPNLLTTTLAPAAAAPFSQTDWRNPERRERGQVDVSPNLLGTTLAPAAEAARSRAATFARRVIARPRADVGAISNLLTTTLAPTAAPFAQTDWRNPVTKARRQIDVAPNLLASTLAAAPFSQTDWTNPVWRISQQAIEFQNLFGSTLAPANPFRQTEWANPIRQAVQQSTDVQNLLATTLTPADPFKQTDWTTPVWRVSQQVGDFQNLLTTTLAPAPAAAAQTTARTQAGGPRKPYPTQRQARRLQGDGDGEAVYSRDLVLPDVDIDIERGEVTTRARLDEKVQDEDGGEGIVAKLGLQDESFGIVKRGAIQTVDEQDDVSEAEKAMQEEDRRIRLLLLSR